MSYPMETSDLERLQITPELQNRSFGVSRVQRYLGFGYNRAARLIELALAQGVLVKDSDCDWLVKLNKTGTQR